MTDRDESDQLHDVAIPSTSSATNCDNGENSSRNSPFIPITLEMIRPYPKALPRKKATGGRARGKSCILTNTPEKQEIATSKKVKINSNAVKSIKRQVFEKSGQKVLPRKVETEDQKGFNEQ